MQTITAAERERIDNAYKDLDALCKKHKVEICANNQREFWFECIEYKEPEPPELKVIK